MKDPAGCEWASWVDYPMTLAEAVELVDTATARQFLASFEDELLEYDDALDAVVDELEKQLPRHLTLSSYDFITIRYREPYGD